MQRAHDDALRSSADVRLEGEKGKSEKRELSQRRRREAGDIKNVMETPAAGRIHGRRYWVARDNSVVLERFEEEKNDQGELLEPTRLVHGERIEFEDEKSNKMPLYWNAHQRKFSEPDPFKDTPIIKESSPEPSPKDEKSGFASEDEKKAAHEALGAELSKLSGTGVDVGRVEHLIGQINSPAEAEAMKQRIDNLSKVRSPLRRI